MNARTGSATQDLASFSSELVYGDIPDSAVRLTKMLILDWLGSAIVGSTQKPAKLLLSIVDKLGGTPESTIVAHARKTSCINAALVNGAMSHIVELDDVHKSSILHPGAAIIPAALAMSEREGADGKSLLTAIVAGYDVAIRIGEGVNPSHYRYWHTTGTCGTFGAAVAAGKILDLDTDGMVNALGSAGTQAAGLWEFASNGSMSKHLHPGKAAANGVLAALLARNGFTGASTIIEGKRGFCEAMSESYDLSRMTANLGNQFRILEVSLKPYASCRHTHSLIDVILKIRSQTKIRPQDVERIRVRTYSVALQIAGNERPRTPFEAKFSLSYCASVALVRGRAGLDSFNSESLNDQAIRDLMGKVEITTDPEFDRQHPGKWPAKVELRTRDGKEYSAMVEFPLGDPENPIKDEDLQAKFKSLASTALEPRRVERIVNSVARTEKITDTRLLTKLLQVT